MNKDKINKMTDEKIVLEIADLLKQLRQQKPLVHHITNYVTVNDCANIVLALGASPIMADDINEVADITAISSALLLNIGTLNQRTAASMLEAGKAANASNIPVILDPVGAGVSKLRNQTIANLLEEVKISVLRGNMSEIRYIAGYQASTRGVDASASDLEIGQKSVREIASKLAGQLDCVVAITGPLDTIADGERTIFIENGQQMLADVTGTGCMSTSLIAAFCGAADDYLLSASAGILAMGIAGEMAFELAGEKGTASYRTAIIDSISKLEQNIIQKRAKLYEK